MKQKTPRVVVTFHTTAEAMATERACRDGGLEGKLISAPRSLSADCGIAWSAPLETRDALAAALAAALVETAGFHELEV
jgi:hypothetical protein